jgi:signal transduction histidine kinase
MSETPTQQDGAEEGSKRRQISGLRYQVVDEAGQLRMAAGTEPLKQAVAAFAAQTPVMTRVIEAIDSMPEGFILFDAEDRLVLVNPQYREFYPEIADLLVPGRRFGEIAAAVEARREAGQLLRVDGWVRGVGAGDREEPLPDGRWVRVSERVLDGGGTVGTRTDITDLKLREATLREIERLKTDFINNVSHELRTPLASVHAALGLMAGGAIGPLPPDAVELVTVALRNSERLLRLVGDILDLGKIDANAITFELGEHDLAPAVRLAVEDTVALGKSRNVRIEVAALPVAQARIDTDRFTQALGNLLSNAVKFSPEGGMVKVAVERAGTMWRITVADDGVGIQADDRERIFERFFQASNGGIKGGTGLGLSIARSIMQGMGGAIGFESESGKGSRFWLDVRAV